jgi:hypothetical protein
VTTLALLLLLAQPGQTTPPPPPQPAAQAPAPQEVPHQLLLGRRIAKVRSVCKASNTVVVVSNAASYIEAIAGWKPTYRYPVLIDDGTLASHEDIARFVRAYQPERVVRWYADDAKPGFPERIDLDTLRKANARSWGIPPEHASQPLLLELWKKLQLDPPGIVMMSENDPAWPAALALASAHGQPIFNVRTRRDVNATLTPDEADQLEKAVEAAADATTLPWKEMGDAIEGVTLCLNVPARIDTGKAGECFATTDRIGRLSIGLESGPRWAWTGQVHGNEAQSAYRAMCSIFLSPRTAWVFDGYPPTEPWNYWDGTRAGQLLSEVGIKTDIDDTPRQSSRQWKLRAARPVDANLIFVNSKGGNDYFELEPGQCRSGDVPVLATPALVHFVHSWSAQFPGSRATIAGRFFERGAYAYVGSVHEPFLHAFQTTPAAAGRLISGAPFASAVRVSDPKLWKIAIFGDPLHIAAHPLPRADEPVLANTEDVTANLRVHLTSGQFTDAMRALVLAGRDEQAAALARSVLKERPTAFTPTFASYAIGAAFRTNDNRAVVRYFGQLGELSKDPVMRDMLWLASYPLLDAPDQDLLVLLRNNLRTDQMGRDATTLAAAWARRHGRAEADQLLQAIRLTVPEHERARFDEALKRPFDTWGE